MKLETLLLLLRGAFLIGAGMFIAAGGVLQSWKEKGVNPNGYDWGQMLCTVGGVMCTNGLAFISTSVGDLLKQKRDNGGTQMWGKLKP